MRSKKLSCRASLIVKRKGNMEPFTICMIVGGILAACGAGVGVKIYYSNKLNKKHKEWQDAQKKMQEEIDRLKNVCKDKDAIIEELLKKRAASDNKLKEEVAKRDAILKIIEAMEQRMRPTGQYAVFTASAVGLAGTLTLKPYSHEDELASLYDFASGDVRKLLTTTAQITLFSPLNVLEKAATSVLEVVGMSECNASMERLLVEAKGVR